MSGTADRVAETLILAPEFDAQAYVRLTALLQDMGAQCIRQWSGVGGSQDYFFAEHQLGEDSVVVVENETYLGLSITTDTDTIAMITRIWGSCG